MAISIKHKIHHSAFTLIELLVVIAIIGLLSTLSVVAFNSVRAKARDARRLSDVKQIATALEFYYNDNGRYPAPPTPAGTPITGLCLSNLGISATCGANTYLRKFLATLQPISTIPIVISIMEKVIDWALI